MSNINQVTHLERLLDNNILDCREKLPFLPNASNIVRPCVHCSLSCGSEHSTIDCSISPSIEVNIKMIRMVGNQI